jgi:hypothetical protein
MLFAVTFTSHLIKPSQSNEKKKIESSWQRQERIIKIRSHLTFLLI